jgi:hypothetical protein
MRAFFAFPLFLICAAPVVARADGIAPMALNSVGAVPAKITGAQVMDMHGVTVGSVMRIETDAMGKPLRADVSLTGGRTIFIDASAMSYDESANILVTAMDQKQLAQMAQQPRG